MGNLCNSPAATADSHEAPHDKTEQKTAPAATEQKAAPAAEPAAAVATEQKSAASPTHNRNASNYADMKPAPTHEQQEAKVCLLSACCRGPYVPLCRTMREVTRTRCSRASKRIP